MLKFSNDTQSFFVTFKKSAQERIKIIQLSLAKKKTLNKDIWRVHVNLLFFTFFIAMIIPLVLCLYLLFLVIDPVRVGVWLGSDLLVWLGGFHLLLFLLLIVLFRDEFYALATKHQTRIVFNPRVYGFFACAVGSLLATILFSGTFFQLLSRGVLLSFFLFWSGVKLFNFFPIKTSQTQQVVFLSVLLGCGAFLCLVRGSLGQKNDIETLGSTVIKHMVGVGTGIQENIIPNKDALMTGLTGRDIEEIGATVTIGSDGTTGELLDEEDNSLSGGLGGGVDIENDTKLTYRVLLPYLNDLGWLPATNNTPVFSNVSRQADIYQAFQRARALKMIGTNINPDRQIRCENLMVLYGLAKNRTVDGTKGVLTAYREAATQNNSLGSCLTRQQIATQAMLREFQ